MIIKRSQQMSSPFNTCISKSNHMCSILDVNGNPLIFGSNYYNIKINTTTHAEVDAFTKLVNKMGRIRRKITIDLVIIRTNGGNSKPCSECQIKIHEMSLRFHIRNIYYTNNDFDVEMIKFSKL